RGELAGVVHHRRVPDRYEPLDVRFVDLFERAVTLAVVTHALGRDVLGVLPVVDQIARGLRRGSNTERQQHPEERDVLHGRPSLSWFISRSGGSTSRSRRTRTRSALRPAAGGAASSWRSTGAYRPSDRRPTLQSPCGRNRRAGNVR